MKAKINPALAGLVRPIAGLREDPDNAREHDAENVRAIAASYRDSGQQKPIVVMPDGTVVAGSGQLRAAISLGWDEIAVIPFDGTPEQAEIFGIADNRTAELATWSAALPEKLARLRDIGVDLQEHLAFSDKQIVQFLAGSGAVVEDEGPGDPPDDPITKPGDLLVLGDHRLLCGDSTKADDVTRLMDGHRAAIVATDPPYLVDYTGDRPNDSGKDWTDKYREVDIKDADAFFRAIFENVKRVVAPNAAIYCWHAHKRSGDIQRVWRDLGILDHQQIVWVKPTAVFGRVYWHFRHEPCMMGWVQGSKPEHNGNHEFDSVWEIDWEGKARIVGNEHPTQKPLEIFARPMRKHTDPGAICYEPFGGSGSQIIAAEQLGRRCFAMEISPAFCDVIVARWEKFAGQKAVRE